MGVHVSEHSVGDKVLLIGDNILATEAIVPVKQCVKIPQDVEAQTAASLLYIYATAIQALSNLARILEDEVVLVNAADNLIGLAAVHICKIVGAKVRLMLLFGCIEAEIAGFRDYRQPVYGGLDLRTLRASITAYLLHKRLWHVGSCQDFLATSKY